MTDVYQKVREGHRFDLLETFILLSILLHPIGYLFTSAFGEFFPFYSALFTILLANFQNLFKVSLFFSSWPLSLC